MILSCGQPFHHVSRSHNTAGSWLLVPQLQCILSLSVVRPRPVRSWRSTLRPQMTLSLYTPQKESSRNLTILRYSFLKQTGWMNRESNRQTDGWSTIRLCHSAASGTRPHNWSNFTFSHKKSGSIIWRKQSVLFSKYESKYTLKTKVLKTKLCFLTRLKYSVLSFSLWAYLSIFSAQFSHLVFRLIFLSFWLSLAIAEHYLTCLPVVLWSEDLSECSWLWGSIVGLSWVLVWLLCCVWWSVGNVSLTVSTVSTSYTLPCRSNLHVYPTVP